MIRRFGLILLMFAGGLAIADPKDKENPAGKTKGIAGNWLGVLKVSGLELRLGFAVTEKDGKLSGTLNSIDQGVSDIPVETISYQEGKLKLEIPKLGVKYSGTTQPGGDTIQGTFEQGPLKVPMDLKRVANFDVLKRPQHPKPPFPYASADVTFENPTAKITLAGTLTLPKGAGPFPAIILISGSGPQDRNEELLGHKPFLVIADHLTKKGIAVLRYDDRGVGESKGKFEGATSKDFATDAAAAFAFLKTRKEIDPKRIGLVGHSEGGLIAPMVAAQHADVAFVVLLAGPGLPGDEVLAPQLIAVLKSQGLKDSLIQKASAGQKLIIKAVKEGADKTKLEQLEKEFTKDLNDEEKKLLEDDFGKKAALEMLTDPWMKYFLSYDPRPALAKTKCPILAVNGEKDVQVLPKDNLPEIEKTLKSAGHTKYTIKEFPGLNHLFQSCKTGGPQEYATIEETFNVAVLEYLTDWILRLEK